MNLNDEQFETFAYVYCFTDFSPEENILTSHVTQTVFRFVKILKSAIESQKSPFPYFFLIGRTCTVRRGEYSLNSAFMAIS